MNKKILLIISIILVAAIAVVGSVFLFKEPSAPSAGPTAIKENVHIITNETDSSLQPLKVTEHSLSFAAAPPWQVGDILVSGITDTAPNGYIRKITGISQTAQGYLCETQNAVLTDVFEEAHIIKTFGITHEQAVDTQQMEDGVLQLATAKTPPSALSPLGSTAAVTKTSGVSINPQSNGLGVLLELNETFDDTLTIKGQAEITTYLELKLDIQNNQIDFGVAVHTNTDGNLTVDYTQDLFDKSSNDPSISGEYQKDILQKALPNIQFFIGPVPVVITNDFGLSAEISAQVTGQITTTVGLKAKRVSGFEYSSKTGKIEEINQKEYLSDGLQWNTTVSATGELEAGIYAHLITKLYGSTGTDLSVGIAGNATGELGVSVMKTAKPQLFGNLTLSIGPKLKGKLVVSVPIIDYTLAEADLFTLALPPFWEKTWEVPDPIITALQKGDFSCFAGTYIATPEDNDAYGGGQNLSPLTLKNNGSVSGESNYPKTKPVSVEKEKDGTYKCTINNNCYYTVYPVGLIENRKYVLENQSYLKDVVYIVFTYIDGGVRQITYYSDSIANVLVGYKGADWIAVTNVSETIGATVTSGTGISYKVVALENNLDAGGGRIRVVLEDKEGKRWMVPNIPGFQYDRRTGIQYYDIYQYKADPDYKEYTP